MRKGDMRGYFALEQIRRIGKKSIDKSCLPATIEFKPKDCSLARWIAILRQLNKDIGYVQD
jgi:hypothetical protein